MGTRGGLKGIGGSDIIQQSHLSSIHRDQVLTRARFGDKIVPLPLDNSIHGEGKRGKCKFTSPLHPLGGNRLVAPHLHADLGVDLAFDKAVLIHCLKALHFEYHAVNLSVLQHRLPHLITGICLLPIGLRAWCIRDLHRSAFRGSRYRAR